MTEVYQDGWSGKMIFQVGRRLHRCKLPSWFSRWANDIGDGSIFQCDCGKKFVLDHTAIHPANRGVIQPGAKRWPWIEHADNMGPPPKPVLPPPDRKGSRGKAPTKPPRMKYG